MPFCPECRDDFQDWVKMCPDCGVALVRELPPGPEHEAADDEPVVFAAAAPSEPIAHTWAGILEEHGIHCLIKRADLVAAMYVFTYNTGCRIYVLASEVDRAREILAPFLADQPFQV
jgi:hypothetical protein